MTLILLLVLVWAPALVSDEAKLVKPWNELTTSIETQNEFYNELNASLMKYQPTKITFAPDSPVRQRRAELLDKIIHEQEYQLERLKQMRSIEK
jgi:hypothetical protein